MFKGTECAPRGGHPEGFMGGDWRLFKTTAHEGLWWGQHARAKDMGANVLPGCVMPGESPTSLSLLLPL